MTTTKTLADYVSRLNITIKSEPAQSNPNMDGDMDHWLCRLYFEGRVMAVPFSTGKGLRKERDGLPPKMGWEQYQNRPYPTGGQYKHRENIHKLRADYKAYEESRMSPVKPSVESVLDCLASDCSGADQTDQSFENWCADYGYDPDSRKAFSIFETIQSQENSLVGLLGTDNFNALLETERL